MTYPYSSGDVVTASDMNSVGLHLITPSSVTGGTLSGATTSITSGVSSVTVNGVFSANFDNYKIMYAVTASINVGIGLKISGVTSATGYDSKLFYASVYSAAAWTDVAHFATDEWFIGYTNQSERAMASVEMYEPYGNNTVRFSSQYSSYVSGVANGQTVATSGTQSTGFTLLPLSGTFTGGTIRVYGYSNG